MEYIIDILGRDTLSASELPNFLTTLK